MIKRIFALLTLALYSCNQPEKAAIAPEPVTAVVKEEVKIISPYVGDWIGESPIEEYRNGEWSHTKRVMNWQFSLKPNGSFLLRLIGGDVPEGDIASGQWRAGKNDITMFPIVAGKYFFPFACDSSLPLDEHVGYLIFIKPLAEGFEFRFACCSSSGGDYYVRAKRVSERGQ